MFDDILGKKKDALISFKSAYEEVEREMKDIIYEHQMKELSKLSDFLRKEFMDELLNFRGTYVDTVIHLLKHAINYEKEACSECNYKQMFDRLDEVTEEAEVRFKPKKALDVIYVDFIVTADGEIEF